MHGRHTTHVGARRGEPTPSFPSGLSLACGRSLPPTIRPSPSSFCRALPCPYQRSPSRHTVVSTVRLNPPSEQLTVRLFFTLLLYETTTRDLADASQQQQNTRTRRRPVATVATGSPATAGAWTSLRG
ncbi:hypothetical protein KM043_007026 [Ampulex compressa]|nr:hypothetical protein KM043_007026 [Ampulex compressa]